MKYTRLGRTGLEVSTLCLGCMSYGVPDRGTHQWTLDEDTSRDFLRRAVEAGINFFDTANFYSDGTSEEIVGRALTEFARREDIVIASKVFYPMRRGRNAGGLSRKAIMFELDNSLRRLGTDYIDLYQIHRYDPNTPIEVTMEALHDVVKAGKVLHIGASSMWAWQFITAQHAAERNGWTQFATMQNHYNLVYREEEREMLPYCAATGVAALPWSPLARGLVTRDRGAVTPRVDTDEYAKTLYGTANLDILDAVAAIASERGVSRAAVGLAWVQRHPAVAAPIVGFTKPHHLDDALASLDIELTDDEVRRLEAPYTPQPVQGH
jgi:aryl-alcohol dehydrogenase-like predicted oxidoreductase